MSSAPAANIPVPVPDRDSGPFWEACREHRLIAQRCSACGRWRWPPAGVCPQCQRRENEWSPLSGRGTVTAYVIARRAMHPAFESRLPYTIVWVAPDEAPEHVVMLGNLLECHPEDVRVGMPVQVAFEDLPGGATLPQFKPL